MEYLTPPILTALNDICWRIQAGTSVRDAIERYLATHSDSFSLYIRRWWVAREQSLGGFPHDSNQNAYHLAVLELLDRGLIGQPILDSLFELRTEVRQLCTHRLELHIQNLPIKLLIPLLGLQFPAFLLVLLGPILRRLIQDLGG